MFVRTRRGDGKCFKLLSTSLTGCGSLTESQISVIGNAVNVYSKYTSGITIY